MSRNRCLFLLICLTIDCSGHELVKYPIKHYWREYLGFIPPDAFIAGYGKDEKPLFIGRAYFKNFGLIPCQIQPDVKKVRVPYGGINIIDSAIEILCGQPKDFEWLPTNSTNILDDIKGKHLVVGGLEIGGDYYIGRAKHSGEWKIGKVELFLPEKRIYYENGGYEIKALEYEVLLGKPLDYAVDIEYSTGRLHFKKISQS